MKRSKRAGGEEGEGSSERWLVSYSDFITLLMVLFVVLYSMGKVDVEKYKKLAESMRVAFSNGGPVKVVDSQINQAGGADQNGQPNPIVIPGIPNRPPQSEEVAGQLTQMLSSLNLGGSVSVQTNIEGILISVSEKLIFTPGTAELQQSGFPVLDTIIGMLKPVDNDIRIVGHTDNSKPTDPRFKNNWELSSGRAIVIAEYLIKNGINAARITVSGRADTQPLFPNDTLAHRQLNSRAELAIIYKSDSNKIIDTSTITQPDQTQSVNGSQSSGGKP
ncbi:MAG TPA: flagellar motor protein MotB [Anaerolineaceae bacterium]|nr:flagellar motor protein MotB [Anaerolineaceae bacterium]